MRVGIAEIIPARTNESIQSVGIAASFSAADGAGTVHKFFVRCEGRFPGRPKFHVVGKFYGQIFLGDGNHAAFFAMNHGNGRAPVSLTGYRPIAQAVIYFFAALSELAEINGDGVSSFIAGQSVELAAVYENAVLAEGEHRFAALLLYDLRNRKIIFFRKRVIAFVVRGNGHDGACAVGIEYIIRKVYGQLFSRERVCRKSSRKYARLFACR